MAQADPNRSPSRTDAEDRQAASVATRLEEVSKELDPAECEALSELGIYSIHDHATARTITLPEAAGAFADATMVKQFYFEGEDCPLLIVAPIQM